ncbi:hypothetical protein N181_08780 [Sinorhizobium fredii USDA 205]|nr:hypothetical protein N181_08780 [Sinorhizobium fredii USDA 205]
MGRKPRDENDRHAVNVDADQGTADEGEAITFRFEHSQRAAARRPEQHSGKLARFVVGLTQDVRFVAHGALPRLEPE